MNKSSVFIWRIVLIGLLVFLAQPLMAVLAQDTGALTATANENLKIRSGPGTDFPQIGLVPAGESIPILGRNAASDWLFIEYGGVRGWIAAWLTHIDGDLGAAPVTTESGSGTAAIATPQLALRIRSGPGAEYTALGSVPANVTLPVLGRNAASNWLFIEYEGVRGWIAAWLCWITGDLGLVPVTDQSGSAGSGGETPSGGSGEVPAGGAETPSGSVTATTQLALRIRSGPSAAYMALGTVPAGVTLPVLGRDAGSNWILIEYQGTRGWIAAWYCTISGDLSSVPLSNETGTGGTAPSLPPPSGGGGFSLGGQTHTLAHPGEMHYAGMTWVKFQHKWSPGQNPDDLTGRIQQAHAMGFRVLLSIPGTSHPSSIDYASYVQYLGRVAALGADGIEVWNEMNLDREWPAGQIDPLLYVNNMLAPAYHAIKAANPNTLVISGALAPTGVHDGYSVWSDDNYIRGMRDVGAASYMDCVGVHHNAGTTSPDATTGHPADGGGGHYSWYFWPTFNLYAGAFPGKPVCFTELGYLSPEGYGPLPPNFWWAFGNSVSEQAAWLARVTQITRDSGRVRLLIVFNVDLTIWGSDPQAGYAIIRPGGSCPACESLRNVMY